MWYNEFRYLPTWTNEPISLKPPPVVAGVVMIRVEIDSIRVSLMSQDRVVVLKDSEMDRYLPIYIGAFEAEAIRVELQGVPVTRPLTHDLLKTVITDLGGTVDQVLINDLRNDIFYAKITITVGGETLEIDSRPSDAIALAVRLSVPIFVADPVMERAAIEPEDEIEAEDVPTDIEPRRTSDKPEKAASSDEDLSVFEDFLDTLDLDDLEDSSDD